MKNTKKKLLSGALALAMFASAGVAISTAVTYRHAPVSITASAVEGNGTLAEPWLVGATENDSVNVYIDGDTLIVNGNGYMMDFGSYSNRGPWLSLASQITKVKICSGVKSIGANAFYASSWKGEYDTLKDIEFEEDSQLEMIGKSAFSSCGGLKNVKLPESVTTIKDGVFYNCEELRSVYIPSAVTELGTDEANDGVFEYCYKLNEVTFGEDIQLTSFGVSVFNGCDSLKSIEIPESVQKIGSYAFYGCSVLTDIKLPNGLQSISTGTFGSCDLLTSIEIPEGVQAIGERAFEDCRSLTSIEIPEGVQTIGESAFDECYNLTSVSLPSTLKNVVEEEKIVEYAIGKKAFYYCINLTEVKFAENSENKIDLHEEVFEFCYSLTSIELPDYIQTIGNNAFCQCHALKEVKLPNSLTYISEDCFSDCALESIEIPGSVEYIKRDAFDSCVNLKSVIISDGVLTIRDEAFEFCFSLTDVVIPKSVETIEGDAFNGCYALTTIYWGWGENEDGIPTDLFNKSDEAKEATIVYYSASEPADNASNYWRFVNGKPMVWEGYSVEAGDSDNTMKAVCDCGEHEVVLTITYEDGEVKVEGADEFAGLGLTVSDVLYTGVGGTQYENSNAPEAAGKYQASVTCENITAFVEFEIEVELSQVTMSLDHSTIKAIFSDGKNVSLKVSEKENENGDFIGIDFDSTTDWVNSKLTVPTIVYVGINETEYENEQFPTEKGDYLAKIVYSNGKFSVTFEAMVFEIKEVYTVQAGDNDYSMKAVCECGEHNVTLTLSVIGSNVTLIGAEAWEEIGLTLPEISYVGVGDTVYESDVAPTEVGSYKVVMSYGDSENAVTAEKEFNISANETLNVIAKLFKAISTSITAILSVLYWLGKIFVS